MVQWAIGQGIGAVLALVMFLVYRADAKANAEKFREDAKAHAERIAKSESAWMEFGMQQGALMTRTVAALERIETRLEGPTLCPVTQVTGEILREQAAGAPQRRRIDEVMRTALQRQTAAAEGRVEFDDR